ncbi:MAG: hypothetical protein ACLPTB_01465 [Acidimicrobiales bacterium]|jgi:hypothetical protein
MTRDIDDPVNIDADPEDAFRVLLGVPREDDPTKVEPVDEDSEDR